MAPSRCTLAALLVSRVVTAVMDKVPLVTDETALATDETTLVTAFYPIKSKFVRDVYLEWIKAFVTLVCPRIVVFTSSEMAPIITALRPDGLSPMHVVVLEFEELESWKRWQTVWKQHHALDPERSYHTPELYALWAQKPFFVSRAIDVNPFRTKFFMWCDIGVFRSPPSDHTRNSFPTSTFLQTDRLLMLAIAPLQADDDVVHADGIRGDFSFPAVRNGGGVFGGGKPAHARWLSAYCAQIEAYISARRFAGKDQSVMLSTYLNDRSLAFFVRATDRGDPWFFLTRLCCSGSSADALVLDTTYAPESQTSQHKFASVPGSGISVDVSRNADGAAVYTFY